jgi:hypothetical protein
MAVAVSRESTDRCPQHNTLRQERDSAGWRFPNGPVCLECLPPHVDGCQLREYLEQTTLWLGWQWAESPTFDLWDSAFWQRFRAVPVCKCPARQGVLMSHPRHHRPRISAWTHRSLRGRLQRFVRRELRVPSDVVRHLELGSNGSAGLAEMCGNNAREVLEKLERSEREQAQRTRRPSLRR